MPYIEVETVPEGAEEASVVSKEDYDTLQKFLDELEKQRDELADAVKAERDKARDASAKYASLLLDQRDVGGEPEPKKQEPRRPMSVDELFS